MPKKRKLNTGHQCINIRVPKDEFGKIQGLVDSFVKDNQQLSEDLLATRTELDHHKTRLTAVNESEIPALRAALDEKNSAFIKFNEQAQASQKRLTETTQELAGARTDLNHYMVRVTQAQERLSAQQSEISALNAALDEKNSAFTRLDEQAQVSQQRLTETTQELVGAITDLNHHRARLTQAQERLLAQESEILDLRSVLDEKNSSFTRLDEEAQASQQRLTETTQELARVSTDLGQKETELTQTLDRLSATQSERGEALSKLQQIEDSLKKQAVPKNEGSWFGLRFFPKVNNSSSSSSSRSMGEEGGSLKMDL